MPLFVAECLALFGISVGWALVVGLFSVGLFYGFAPKNFIEDEKPDDGMAEVIAKNMGYGTLITQDENDA